MPELVLDSSAVLVQTRGAYQEMIDEEGLWRVALAWRFEVPEQRAELRRDLVARLHAAIAELGADQEGRS